MKRLIAITVAICISAAPAWAASKPLAPGTYTVTSCPPAVVCPQCPPPTVCADAAPCPVCPACPVEVQPLPVLCPERADAPALVLAPVANTTPRWEKASQWIIGALIFRHVILSLDDDHASPVVADGGGHGHYPCPHHDCD